MTSEPPALCLRLELSAHITISRLKGLRNFLASSARSLILSQRHLHSVLLFLIGQTLLVIQGIAGATLNTQQFPAELEFCEVPWRILRELLIFLSKLVVIYCCMVKCGGSE